MSVTERRRELMSDLRGVFGERVQVPDAGGATLAVVSPETVGEVESLARLAERHSVSTAVEGAGMVGGSSAREGIVVRFDSMRAVSVPKPPHYRVEAEPGATWQEVDDRLREHGRTLRVHPTSAPRATVGGWVALDGLGVGSYEHGWLSENVVSADLVLPGGYRVMASGNELPLITPVGSIPGIIVSATLETRPLARDVPFAAAFNDPVGVSRAANDLHEAGVPLWHLGLRNSGMSSSREQGEGLILFGAYPAERSDLVEDALRTVFDETNGVSLSPAEAYRVWGTRHFPTSLRVRVPEATHVLVPIRGLGEVLSGADGRKVAIQGSVGGAGEALLLAFERDGGALGKLRPGEKERLIRSALDGGGREHLYWIERAGA
jgi:glycolate oxidase